MISPIVCPDRELTPNATGMTLMDIRNVVERVAEDLRASGDTKIISVKGLKVLGHREAHLLEDGIHPGQEGYRLMAERLSATLEPMV